MFGFKILKCLMTYRLRKSDFSAIIVYYKLWFIIKEFFEIYVRFQKNNIDLYKYFFYFKLSIKNWVQHTLKLMVPYLISSPCGVPVQFSFSALTSISIVMDWMAALPVICLYLNPWNLWMWHYSQMIKSLRRDHCLSKWVLSSMTSVSLKEIQRKDTWMKRTVSCTNGIINLNYTATS